MHLFTIQLVVTLLVLWEMIYGFLLAAGSVTPYRLGGWNYWHLVRNHMIAPAVLVPVALLFLTLIF